MPYSSISELPPAVKERYSARCQSVFMRAFNAHDGDEASRFKVAHTAAGNCKAAGKAMIDESKAVLPIKAQLFDAEELDAWLDGRHPRRLLAIPFGGPIPSAKSSLGVDLDGHYFDEQTDIYGPYKALRETRDRLVDWHHSYAPPYGRAQGPTGGLTGTIIGKAVLDAEPEEDGWWVDFWVKAGQKRTSLIRQLAERGAQLFGSSQIVPGSGKINNSTGHIERWPMVLETLTTSPQNTLSTFRTAKAVLDEADDADISLSGSFRELLATFDNLGADLSLTSYPDGDAGDVTAKAGRVLAAHHERSLRELTDALQRYLDLMANRPSDPPAEGDASTS